MIKIVIVKDNGLCLECGLVLVICSGGYGLFFGCLYYLDC